MSAKIASKQIEMQLRHQSCETSDDAIPMLSEEAHHSFLFSATSFTAPLDVSID